MRDAFFYALSAVLLILAGFTVLARNLFRAALSLLGVLLCTAVLFVLLRAEMVALAQVMVYIGGIMIFVLYAVLLTSHLGSKMEGPSILKTLGALVVSGVTLAFLARLVLRSRVVAESAADAASNAAENAAANGIDIASIKSLGLRLLDPGPDGFLVPFELISVLLLAAMVGAIAIARTDGAKETAKEAGA